AASLARGLKNGGVPLFAGGTDSHMVVVDLRQTQWQEAEVNAQLERHGLIGNTTTLPRRAGDRTELGLRLGSTPMTIRGLDAENFAVVASSVAALIKRGPGAAVDEQLRRKMKEIALAHPIPFG